MTVEQLKYFIQLADDKTIIQASVNLHISPAGLSKAISELEKELGFPLFIRNRHGSILSKQGENFLPSAKKIVADYTIAMTKAREIRQSSTEFIRIASTSYFSSLYNCAIDLNQKGNGLSIQLAELPSTRIIDLIKNGKFDLGLVALPKGASDNFTDLHVVPIKDGSVKLYLPKTSPFYDYKYLSSKIIKQIKFVMFDDSENNTKFKQLEEKIGLLRVDFYGGNNFTTVKAASDLGDAFLAREFQVDENNYPLFANFRPFDISKWIETEYSLCWVYRNEYHISETAKRIISSIKK